QTGCWCGDPQAVSQILQPDWPVGVVPWIVRTAWERTTWVQIRWVGWVWVDAAGRHIDVPHVGQAVAEGHNSRDIARLKRCAQHCHGEDDHPGEMLRNH